MSVAKLAKDAAKQMDSCLIPEDALEEREASKVDPTMTPLLLIADAVCWRLGSEVVESNEPRSLILPFAQGKSRDENASP